MKHSGMTGIIFVNYICLLIINLQPTFAASTVKINMHTQGVVTETPFSLQIVGNTTLPIVVKGVPAASIVLADNASLELTQVATDIKTYTKQSKGAMLPIILKYAPLPDHPRLWVG